MAAKQRNKRKYSEGVAHIQATFNNTLVTITNPAGDSLCHSSAGEMGFKGSRKGTPYAAQLAGEDVAKKAADLYDLKRVAVEVSGPGAGRESAIRALRSAGLDVVSLKEKTSIPHNGCRPRKKRRV
jgi:small subunit ribosomal protein S11